MKYNLIETATNRILGKNVELSSKEANTLNYAYALNTGSRYKYILASANPDKVNKTKEVIVFKYESPI